MRSFIWLFSLILVSGLLYGYNLKNEDPNKDKLLLEIISYVLERGHYSPKEINDAFSENVYMDYLNNLDGQHRFFLQSDINSFESYKYKIDDQIKNAELIFFDLTYKKLIERMDQVQEFYKELLEKPFDFAQKEEIDLDFETVPYALNTSELKKLWRKRFKLNALQNFTSKKEDESKQAEKDSTFTVSSDADLEIQAREDIEENMGYLFENFNELKRKDWFSIFINSIVVQFDPHTFYLAPSDKDRFDTSMSGKFEGIGARLNKRNQQVKIVEIISGGPVWRDELLEIGDVIMKVGQEGEEPVDISGMVLDDAVKLIKGPKGTQVYLTIKRVDGTVEVVTVTRDVVVLEETYARSSLIKDSTGTYGLIELPKFYINFQDYTERNAATDVKKELEQLKQKNVKGIILDLRNNGGGSLKTVVDMTGYFIEGMHKVVERGTARVAKIPGIEVCGKTGTAENFIRLNGEKTQLTDHSIFIAFAPKESPKIALAVFVENGYWGGRWAAPIASLMIEKYLKGKVKRTWLENRMLNGSLKSEYLKPLSGKPFEINE